MVVVLVLVVEVVSLSRWFRVEMDTGRLLALPTPPYDDDDDDDEEDTTSSTSLKTVDVPRTPTPVYVPARGASSTPTEVALSLSLPGSTSAN